MDMQRTGLPTLATALLAIVANTAFTPSCAAQAAPSPQEADRVATLAKATGLRDAFIERTHALGFQCSIAPPKILIEDVPSFGQYEETDNTLRTTAWTLLNPGEKAFFMALVGPGATEATAHDTFEKAAHGWIFVHEMGHWFQQCQGYISDHSHYEVESGANRISLAYWRAADPSIASLMMTMFHTVIDHTPSPVPKGEGVEAYFNKNYESLGPGPAYPWFQSHMSIDLEREKPEPSLQAVLSATKK